MARIERIARCSLALTATLALVGPATADTWVVDDDGGPGVDDTSLAAAIAGASHGDRIQLFAGVYPADVDCVRGVTIVGVGSPLVSGEFYAHDLPSHGELRISGVRLDDLRLVDCHGPVLLSDNEVGSAAGRMAVIGCADVRALWCQFGSSATECILVEDSHLELVSSTVTGAGGCIGCGDGTIGMSIKNGGSASVADCTIMGGDGGWTAVPLQYGSNGESGVYVGAGCELRVTGTSANLISGGDAGTGWDWDYDGFASSGIFNSGSVVLSGVTVEGGSWYDETYTEIQLPPVDGGGSLVTPSPADPVLAASGSLSAGQDLHLVVHGEPGTQVALLAGRGPRMLSWPGTSDPLLVQPSRTIPLGTLPGSGTLTHIVPLPAHYVAGDRFVLQVLLTGGPEPRLTNSLPLVLN